MRKFSDDLVHIIIGLLSSYTSLALSYKLVIVILVTFIVLFIPYGNKLT